jgi:hypothetical protein
VLRGGYSIFERM